MRKKQDFYLKKGDDLFKFYRKRWFVICANFLFYYDSDKDYQPNGVIPLYEFKLVQDSDPFVFHIVTATRTYDLKAPNKEELEGWWNAIQFRKSAFFLPTMEFPKLEPTFESVGANIFYNMEDWKKYSKKFPYEFIKEEMPLTMFKDQFGHVSESQLHILISYLATKDGNSIPKKNWKKLLNAFGKIRGEKLTQENNQVHQVNSLEALVATLEYKWFHPFLSEEESKIILENQKIGTYLVRICEKPFRCFALDVTLPNQIVLSKKFICTPSGYIFYGDSFFSIKNIIDSYSHANTFLPQPYPIPDPYSSIKPHPYQNIVLSKPLQKDIQLEKNLD